VIYYIVVFETTPLYKYTFFTVTAKNPLYLENFFKVGIFEVGGGYFWARIMIEGPPKVYKKYTTLGWGVWGACGRGLKSAGRIVKSPQGGVPPPL